MAPVAALANPTGDLVAPAREAAQAAEALLADATRAVRDRVTIKGWGFFALFKVGDLVRAALGRAGIATQRPYVTTFPIEAVVILERFSALLEYA